MAKQTNHWLQELCVCPAPTAAGAMCLSGSDGFKLGSTLAIGPLQRPSHSRVYYDGDYVILRGCRCIPWRLARHSPRRFGQRRHADEALSGAYKSVATRLPSAASTCTSPRGRRGRQ